MKALDLEWSHGRIRPTVRTENTTAPAAVDADAKREAETGRLGKGNTLWRRRQLKRRAEGIATLNPSKVPTWMRPHVQGGAPYIVALLGMLEGKPALHALAGDCADSHVVYRALLSLALGTDDPRARATLLGEARGWLREHRTALATLCALAGGLELPSPKQPMPWFEEGASTE